MLSSHSWEKEQAKQQLPPSTVCIFNVPGLIVLTILTLIENKYELLSIIIPKLFSFFLICSLLPSLTTQPDF